MLVMGMAVQENYCKSKASINSKGRPCLKKNILETNFRIKLNTECTINIPTA